MADLFVDVEVLVSGFFSVRWKASELFLLSLVELFRGGQHHSFTVSRGVSFVINFSTKRS